MAEVQLKPLPYRPDCLDWYLRLRALPWPLLLDSCREHGGRGRFDIVSAAPREVLLQRAAEPGEPWQALLAAERRLPHCARHPDLPFVGGLLGFAGYDLGRRQHGLAPPATDTPLPDLYAGLYDWAVINDHHLRRSLLVALPDKPRAEIAALLERLLDESDPSSGSTLGPPVLTTPFASNLDPAGYKQRFDRVQRYIQAGDCYQVNLARRFQAGFHGDPLAAYQRLRRVAGAPYSAYAEGPDWALLSLSPERFLHCVDGAVQTEPIKGTMPRAADPGQDRENARQLLASDKDRAENLMIVDLLRNDLGQCCVPGSIRVERLFELQSFNTVHHLVSSISGRLRPEHSLLGLLGACFPGGSITGAPKRRAMQIIDELEPQRREIFCGSVFYRSSCGQMDSSIAIRSFAAHSGQLFAWAGGGIVADSHWEAEYRETLAKIGGLLRALETMGLDA